MDVSDFIFSYNTDEYNDIVGKCYEKDIGDYVITVYTGKWCYMFQSSPVDFSLDINNYTHVNIEILDKERGLFINCIDSDIKDYIENNLLCYNNAYSKLSYDISIFQLEKICNKLNDLSLIKFGKSGTRQEAPCPLCKNNNDIGIASCWSCGTKLI